MTSIYTYQSAGYNFIVIAIGVMLSQMYFPSVTAGEAVAIMLVGVGLANLAVHTMVHTRQHPTYDERGEQ